MTNAQTSGCLLLVEDHQDIAELVFEYMEQKGYELDYAPDGEIGLNLASENDYDAVILDLMLPRRDGLEVCRKLREDARKSTPVLMLTARDTLEDKLTGLETGADDYLVKPFDIQELEARVRSLVRRNRGEVTRELLQVGDLTFDTHSLLVERAGKQIQNSPIGLRILGILMRASPRVVSRVELEREIWGEALPDSDTLRSHMYNLRKAIDRPFDHALLHTLTNTGYRLYDSSGSA